MIKKLNKVFDAGQRRKFILLAILIFIGGVLETFGVSMLMPIVTAILDPEALHGIITRAAGVIPALGALTSWSDKGLISFLLIALIGVYVVKNLFLLFLTYRQNRFINHAKCEMISRTMQEFLHRPYEKYLGADIPTTFRLTDSDIPNTFSLTLILLQLMTESIVAVFLCVFLLIVNWRMTLILIAILGVLTLLNSKVLKPVINETGKRNQDLQTRIAKWRLQATYGLKDVKILNRQDYFVRNYYETGRTGADVATRYAVLNAMPRLLIETVFMAAVLLFILFFVLGGGSGTALIAQMAAFGIAAMRVMPGANRINTYLAEIAYLEPHLDFVYEKLLESEKEALVLPALTEKKVPVTPIALTKEIRLSDVTYRYPDSDKNILTKASMVIPKGKSVGIMGASGAGKSTLVDVLLGLLGASGGEITCDGESIFAHYDAWLAQIGYIPQTIFLVDETIRANIAFGIEEEEIDEDRIWEVLQEAQLTDFVKSLPDGLDTTVGDRGVRLSGGQRQRIGIARALYHDPEILVFDEATSALDNETEAALMEAINAFHGKKTMVIIAHRLNTIAGCDLIYKVENEKILETTL